MMAERLDAVQAAVIKTARAAAVAAVAAYDAHVGRMRWSEPWREWNARRLEAEEALCRALYAAGFTVTAKGPDSAVRGAGIRATSTCGPRAAVRNWIAAADRRSER